MEKIFELYQYVDAGLYQTFKNYRKQIHIKGMMDGVFFLLRQWLVRLNVEVTVEGEGWEAFGINTTKPENELWSEIVSEDNYAFLEAVYKDYMNTFREERNKMERLLKHPVPIMTDTGRKKILFYLTNYFWFADSIGPLIFFYLQNVPDRECVVVFPSIQGIIHIGKDNARKMSEYIEKVESTGGKCYCSGESELYTGRYEVCYLCSEYSGRLPQTLRELTKWTVTVQTSGLYSHMYICKGRFESVFSEMAFSETDYVIASEYMAEWICRQDSRWKEKMLKFGYPKLDTLYYALHCKPDIPPEWKEKVKGKRCFLFTTINLAEKWLEALKAGENIVIWRPHPLVLADVEGRKRVNGICEKYQVIIDSEPSYYASFWLSDAHIAAAISSVTVNYLYMEKPLCIFDDNEEAIIDYRREAWYKSAFIARKEEEVLEFIELYQRGLFREDVSMIENRRKVIGNFDGRTCEKICRYFENKSEK